MSNYKCFYKYDIKVDNCIVYADLEASVMDLMMANIKYTGEALVDPVKRYLQSSNQY